MGDWWSRLWTVPWSIKIAILVAIGGFATAMVFAALLRVTNEAWIAIGTAAYATFTVFTFGVLLVAAIGALRQLSLADQERRLGILLQLSSRWDSQTLRIGRRLVNKSGKNLQRDIAKYEARDDEKYYLMVTVANFFEDVGIIAVKRGSCGPLRKQATAWGPQSYTTTVYSRITLMQNRKTTAPFSRTSRN